MGNPGSKEDFDVEAHWKSEAKLSKEQRRKRYHKKHIPAVCIYTFPVNTVGKSPTMG
jgi:hypothetical protein